MTEMHLLRAVLSAMLERVERVQYRLLAAAGETANLESEDHGRSWVLLAGAGLSKWPHG